MKIVSLGLIATLALSAPISSASARDHFHGHGGRHFGLLGALVVGAVTIATAPVVLLADAVSEGHRGSRHHDRESDDGYGRGYDRPQPYEGDPRGAYEAPPPQYNYGPPPQASYYAPPPGYYAQGRYAQQPQYQQQQYPPQQYAPPQAPYAQPQYGPPQYVPEQGYPPPQAYYPPPDGE